MNAVFAVTFFWIALTNDLHFEQEGFRAIFRM